MYSLPVHLLPDALGVWSRSYPVFAPQESAPGGPVLLEPFSREKGISLNYINFPMPVPDFTLPETLFAWKRDVGRVQASPCLEETPPQVIFGVRPCDIAGLACRDAFFSGEYPDPHYLARRKSMILVALNCAKAGDCCFCKATGTGPFADRDADIVATLDGEKLLFEALSAQGHTLLDQIKSLLHTVDREQGASRVRLLRGEALATFSRDADLSGVDTALAAMYNSGLWEENARLCINCTGCTMVCPTCTCFQTVETSTDPGGASGGQRLRCKDSCQTTGFTRNAGFHNPRSHTSAFRYRIMDKLLHVGARFGRNAKACVGCGRCIEVCPAGIDITDIAAKIKASWRDAGSPAPLMDAPKRYERPAKAADQDLYTPRPAVITSVRDDGRDTRRYAMRYVDAAPGETMDLSGQFYMLTVFGVGEIAVSVPFGDAPGSRMEFCVKKVGKVTGALAELGVGDIVGLRGPYGRPFPYEDLKGRDVLIVGSGVGMAPVRTIIVRMMDERAKFGRIAIIASAASHDGIVYADDLRYWGTLPGVTVLYALSKPTRAVRAHVGYVNDLLPGLVLDWPNVRALVCASPKRIKLVAADLQGLGMDADHIYTSLETHMRCGVGKCGHCKVGSHYLCVDGPVFSYREMLELPPEF